MKKSVLPNADFPEQSGINSYELEDLIRDIELSHIEAHSIMIVRNGTVAYESHALPYGRDVRQAMFSVSKVLVAIAVGFAESEGLLTLDSKVLSFFPEFTPPRRDKFLNRLTVRHLMTMTSGKRIAPVSARNADNRLKNFFAAKWNGEPGKTPDYVAENICICCDILRAVTGVTLTEYLKPRLYEPLGFDSVPIWEKDSTGIEGGYWGLYLTPEELAKISVCLLDGGLFNGVRVIPESFAAEVISMQSKNIPFQNKHSVTDFGLFTRMGNLRHTCIIDGSFSQISILFRDYNTAFVFTGNHLACDETISCIFRHFPRMLVDCRNTPPSEELCTSLSPMPVIKGERNTETEVKLNGRVMQFRSNALLNALGFPFSILPFTSIHLDTEKGGNINNIVLAFESDRCIFSWDEGRDHNMLHCTMTGRPVMEKIRISGFDYNVISAAAWTEDGFLEISVRPCESVAERRIVLEFGKKDSVIMTGVSANGTDDIIDEMGDIAADNLETEGVVRPMGSLIGNLSFILSSPIHGKIN